MPVSGGVAERKQIPPKNIGESQLIVHIFCGIKIYWQCCTNTVWLHMTIHNYTDYSAVPGKRVSYFSFLVPTH